MIYEWLLKQGASSYQKRYIMSVEVKLGKTGCMKTCLTKTFLLWTYKKSHMLKWDYDTITFTWNRCVASLLSKLGTFHDSVMQYKSAAMCMPTWGFQNTSEKFQIKYILYDVLPKGASEVPEEKVKSSKKAYFHYQSCNSI